MKKKFLLFLLTISAVLPAVAQLEAVGSTDYGRIFDITYDPVQENTLYASSLYNHILKSEDNGNSWEVFFSLPASDVTRFRDMRLSHNNTALSVIKYNPDSPNNTLLIIDLATAEIQEEIQIPNSSSVKYIKSYDFYPSNPDIMIMDAVIDFGTMEHTYYTTDGGLTWDLVYSKGDHDNVSINKVSISPNDPLTLFLTRGFGPTSVDGGLFYSEDGGTTWTEKLPGVILDPIVFNPHNTNVVYMGTGISFGSVDENLYRSVDAGETWQIIPISWVSEQLDNITRIGFNPIDANHIVVLEENEIAISYDNGVTWTNHWHDSTDIHGYYYGTSLSFNPFNEDQLYINADYHVQFSEDKGETVTWAKNNFFTATGSLGYDASGDGHLYYGVQYGYIHRNLETEEESDFDIVPIDWFVQGDAPKLLVDEAVSGRLLTYSSGWFGSDLEVSPDFGQTKYPVLTSFMNFMDASATNPFDTSVVWVSLSNINGNAEILKIDLSDLNAIVTNSVNLPYEAKINGIVFDPAQQGRVMISLGAEVFVSEDGGQSWTSAINGLEVLDPQNDLILDLSQNPLNTSQLSIATNKGVFTSMDWGESWEQLTTSLVHRISHSNQTDGNMVAIRHNSQVSDFGIMYSKDGGVEWESVDSQELLNVLSTASTVVFHEGSADVYLGTVDLGVMRYTLNLEVLSIGDHSFNEALVTLFPNPTKNFVNVLWEDKLPESIVVYSINGQKILEEKNTSKVDVSHLTSGIYLVEVSLDGNRITKRLIRE